MNTQFAVTDANRLAHISEVERGLACNCRCEICGERVVAKKGEEREHHFAHASNTDACATNYESQLHRYAKELIQERMELTVPFFPNMAPFYTSSGRKIYPRDMRLAFNRVEAEVQIENIRPDIVAYSGERKFLIEVAYSSFADIIKIEKLQALGLDAVEIDLSRFTPDSFDPELVKKAVIDDFEGKKWLYVVPAVAPQQSEHSAPQCKQPIPEEILTIKGMWVSLKHLPFGDLAIRSIAFNPEVNAIVKGVAKRYYGRWNPAFKNWIVPSRWLAQASADLRAAADIGSGVATHTS